MPTTKTLRTGSQQKREAILAAARHLFLTDGFDRSSVDAVAARAGVSKRTVYDYFGDKVTLLRAVVANAGEKLVAAIRRALDETVTGRTDPAGLEDALIAFTRQMATETLGSTEYAMLLQLLTAERGKLNRSDIGAMTDAPEEALGEGLTMLAERGWLEVPDPRLAADHFIMLTFGVVSNRFGATGTTVSDEAGQLLVAGVQTFLRAYRP
ncbi:TetR/AcrR family transcriptional regulator [Actinoplanes sp. N902-109]|uniref:TetR/AcrR family transcriptional regulator n=1 Tax=Actinoplanes sp. (strain N902-109) TaxID=649831 RepID=UPI000329423D|nr:TetR/AcrR family transcriptional regulator [Actinoplanes sp. N902-109]AGL15199.1 TetR family transcriptional regulator [Actinoplanes sp. N902-109]